MLNFLLFQLGWLLTVLLGASAQHAFAPWVVVLCVAIHLWHQPRGKSELRLVLAACAIGLVWENLLCFLDVLRYPWGQLPGGLAPIWLIALWPLLAITLDHSLRWLQGRVALQMLFGAIGGPLAFLAGERLEAVVFPDRTVALLALAAGWVVLFPLLMRFVEPQAE